MKSKKNFIKTDDCLVHNINGITEINKKYIFNKMCSLANINSKENDDFLQIIKDKNSLIGLKIWETGKQYIRLTSSTPHDIKYCTNININDCENDTKCSLFKNKCLPTDAINIFQKDSIIESENGDLFKIIYYDQFIQYQNKFIQTSDGISISNTILLKKLNIHNPHEYILLLPSGEILDTTKDSDAFPCKSVLLKIYKIINDLYISLNTNDRNQFKIWFVGHSLGSTLAQRLAYNISLKSRGISPKNIRIIISGGYIHFTQQECMQFEKVYKGKYLSYLSSIKIKHKQTIKKTSKTFNSENINDITEPDINIFRKPDNNKLLHVNHKNMINNILLNFKKSNRKSCYIYFQFVSKLNTMLIPDKLDMTDNKKNIKNTYHFYKSILRPFIQLM
jgi:hypothetical protein